MERYFADCYVPSWKFQSHRRNSGGSATEDSDLFFYPPQFPLINSVPSISAGKNTVLDSLWCRIYVTFENILNYRDLTSQCVARCKSEFVVECAMAVPFVGLSLHPSAATSGRYKLFQHSTGDRDMMSPSQCLQRSSWRSCELKEDSTKGFALTCRVCVL